MNSRYYAVVPSVSLQQYGPFGTKLSMELFVEKLVEWKHGKQVLDIVRLAEQYAFTWQVYE